jgi:hypothetical protein
MVFSCTPYPNAYRYRHLSTWPDIEVMSSSARVNLHSARTYDVRRSNAHSQSPPTSVSSSYPSKPHFSPWFKVRRLDERPWRRALCSNIGCSLFLSCWWNLECNVVFWKRKWRSLRSWLDDFWERLVCAINDRWLFLTFVFFFFCIFL